MQEQQQSAVSAEAVETGVVNDDRFETLVADMHGFGGSHNESSCEDKSCGRCGKSTSGANFETNERAGDRYDGDGSRSIDAADDSRNDPAISGGNLYEIIQAVDSHRDGEACENPLCGRCNTVNGRTLQPLLRTPPGSSNGGRRRSPKSGTKTCDVSGCGMTLCEHVRGRKEGHVRSVYKPARVTRKTDKILTEQGLSASDALAVTAYAIERGVSFDVAREKVLKKVA